MRKTVAVLFARHDSVYKAFPECDVWDDTRDALNWPGGLPVIAHPPCRSWGRLRSFSHAPPGEHQLALWAVTQVQKYGGVLEHPASSSLWPVAGLPRPGYSDSLGGWSIGISQYWFGHRAEKKTLLYIVGCPPTDMPPLPFVLGDATHVISTSQKRIPPRPQVSQAEREHTPLQLALWLVTVAKRATLLQGT